MGSGVVVFCEQGGKLQGIYYGSPDSYPFVLCMHVTMFWNYVYKLTA